MPPKKRPAAGGSKAAAAVPMRDVPALQAEYDTQLQRKMTIEQRLQVISLPPAPTKTSSSSSSSASTATPTAAAAAAAAATAATGGGGGGGTAAATSPRRRSTKKGAVAVAENESEPRQNKEGTTRSAAAGAAAGVGSNRSASSRKIPIVKEKTDTHWDFVLKEMQWLATDFASERKRHAAGRRKLCHSFTTFQRQRAARAVQVRQAAEAKRRRLASKLGRDALKSWWSKIDKVVTFRQKLLYDEQRRRAMNRQLLRLVQQTELYTESLAQHALLLDDEQQEYDEEDDDESSSPAKRKLRKKRRPPTLTIEQALAKSSRRRNVLNYATLNILASSPEGTTTTTTTTKMSRHDEEEENDDDDDNSQQQHFNLALLYHGGDSTASDTGGDDDDESYQPPASSEREYWDDETTLQQAEVEEQRERRQLRKKAGISSSRINNDEDNDDDDDENDDGSFVADALELRKLEEEQTMDITAVLERLRQEGLVDNDTGNDSGNGGDDDDTTNNDIELEGDGRTKKVQFAAEVQVHPAVVPMEQDGASAVVASSSSAAAAVAVPKSDPGEDADDDGDASDVEDFVDAMQVDHHDIDDGPTAAAAKRSARANTTADQHVDYDVDSGDDDEFLMDEATPLPVDDETTMEEEERLPQEMSVQEEIQLLQREGEMPVEELRRLYAGVLSASAPSSAPRVACSSSDDDDNDDDDDEVEENDSKPSATPPPARRSKRSTRGKKVSPRPSAAAAATEAIATAAATTAEEEEEEEEEYQVKENDADAVDDETTMEAEDKLGREMSYEEELALLQNENEIPIEQLRAMYADALNQGSNNSFDCADDDDDDDETNEDQQDDQPDQPTESMPSLAASLAAAANDDGQDEEQEQEEFQPNAVDEVDDETTMEAEEKLGRDMSYEDEINLLKRESEMSVEELRAMYAGMNDVDEEGEEDEEITATPDEDCASTKEQAMDTEAKRKRDEADDVQSMKKIRADTEDEETAEAGKAALDALDASAERAKNTLASRPYLLSNWVKLREYQQIGLNWLVSLQSRRLNGILADEVCPVCGASFRLILFGSLCSRAAVCFVFVVCTIDGFG
jgi:HSA